MTRQISTTQFFYQNNKLVTIDAHTQQWSVFRHDDLPLAERHSDDSNGLLVTDHKGSVLNVHDSDEK